MSQDDWFVEHLEFFMYGSTIRFLFIVGTFIVLTLISTSYLALMAYMADVISLRVCLGHVAFLLVQSFVVAAVMGISKSCYDSVEHPKHEGYSAYKCITWYCKQRTHLPVEIVGLTECDICKTRADSEKTAFECGHKICPDCRRNITSCTICIKP